MTFFIGSHQFDKFDSEDQSCIVFKKQNKEPTFKWFVFRLVNQPLIVKICIHKLFNGVNFRLLLMTLG